MSERRDELVALRKARGYTQESLAECIEVDRSTVNRWERGGQLQPWHRHRLAGALRISLEELDKLLSSFAVNSPDRSGRESSEVADSAVEAPSSPPRSAPSGDVRGVRIAISGSRAAGTDGAEIDRAVSSLARFVMLSELEVNHGPVGVGIEVMTYIADRYRPSGFTMTRSLFGRQTIVRDAAFLLVVGGARGTADELDLAVSMGVRVIPYTRSGGTAAGFYERACQEERLRSWMAPGLFERLGECGDAEEFVMLVRQLMAGRGASSL